MAFRAVMFANDHSIRLFFPSNNGEFFYWRKGLYFIDRDAVKQVFYKGNQIKGFVESLYNEGNPIPHGSTKKIRELSENNLKAKIDTAQHKPAISILDKLRGK